MRLLGAPAIPAPGLHPFWGSAPSAFRRRCRSSSTSVPLRRLLRLPRVLRTSSRRTLREARAMAHATTSDAPTKPWTDTGTERPIAAWYARQYARQSLSEIEDIKAVARRTAPHIGATSQVLEVAPGPGYLAIEIVRLTGCHLVGVDISETFV